MKIYYIDKTDNSIILKDGDDITCIYCGSSNKDGSEGVGICNKETMKRCFRQTRNYLKRISKSDAFISMI